MSSKIEGALSVRVGSQTNDADITIDGKDVLAKELRIELLPNEATKAEVVMYCDKIEVACDVVSLREHLVAFAMQDLNYSKEEATQVVDEYMDDLDHEGWNDRDKE